MRSKTQCQFRRVAQNAETGKGECVSPKKFRYRRLTRLLSLLLLLAMFLGAGLLHPAFAYMTAQKSIVQMPDAQKLVEQGEKIL